MQQTWYLSSLILVQVGEIGSFFGGARPVLGLVRGGLFGELLRLSAVLGNLNLPAVLCVIGIVMLRKKFLSVVVALAIVGQFSVFAQDSAVGSGGSREIPVSGSELQRQPILNGDPVPVSLKESDGAKSSSLVGQGFVNAGGNIDSQPLILNLVFIGLIFWFGMKFGENRARWKQPPTQK